VQLEPAPAVQPKQWPAVEMRRPVQPVKLSTSQHRSRAFRLFQFQIQHLVEIAIVKLAIVPDADKRAAHQAVHRGGIEIFPEEVHVGVVLALALQVFLEAVNRHVR